MNQQAKQYIVCQPILMLIKALLLLAITSVHYTAEGIAPAATPNSALQHTVLTDRIMSLSSRVQRHVYPNQALVEITISNNAQTLSNAMNTQSSSMDILLQELANIGISTERIRSGEIASPIKRRSENSTSEYFELLNKVLVTAKSQEELNQVSALTDKFTEADITGIEFEHVMPDSMHQALKKEAINQIIKDKTIYENALNVELNTISVNDSDFSIVSSNWNTKRSSIVKNNHHNNIKTLVINRTLTEPLPTEKVQLRKGPFNLAKHSYEEIQYNIVVSVDFEVVKL